MQATVIVEWFDRPPLGKDSFTPVHFSEVEPSDDPLVQMLREKFPRGIVYVWDCPERLPDDASFRMTVSHSDHRYHYLSHAN